MQMTTENKLWEDIKTQYLEQVRKVLSSSKHPRSKEVLEDIRSHLDRRFAELEPHQQTWEDFQKIILEMGPASDYAELLVTETASPRKKPPHYYLLLAASIVMLIGGAILLLTTFLRTGELPQSTIVDKIDYPFVNDPEAVGKWQSVDFVQKIENFKPDVRSWPSDLYLKELIILENGSTGDIWTWTKGLIINRIGKTSAKYQIKETEGSTYMFLEWKSYDYATTKRPPYYYVLKKIQNGSDNNTK
jgi:hypothetical protein